MHIVITGASSGIGAALAKELATLPNATLTLVARRRGHLEALAKTLPCEVTLVERDLSKSDASVTDWLPDDVDILINNAGVQVTGSTAYVDATTAEASVALNLLTPLRLTRAVLIGMLARRRGTIVDIASMAALAPTPGATYYNATKAGLAAASESLRGELRGSGVHIVTVYPGLIPTELSETALAAYSSNLALRLQPRGTTAGLAELVKDAILRKRARVIYPRVYTFVRWLGPVVRFLLDRFTPALAKRSAA